MILAPSGQPRSLPERLSEVCDLISLSPAGSIERSVLHAAHTAAHATSDPAELAAALAKIREVAAGRGVASEDFDAISQAALAIVRAS